MEHDSRLNAWYSTLCITPNTLPLSLPLDNTPNNNLNTMNYIAQDLKEKANAYRGFNIWQDLLMTTEFDSDNSTDYQATWSDGSALVLQAGVWEFEMFDGDGDNLEDNEFDADYDIYLGETTLAVELV